MALAVGTARPAPLQLQPRTGVTVDGQPLKLGAQAIPCVADWNGDGRTDLLVGYQPDFKVALYLNSGSPGAPRLTGFVNLQAGGVDICHPSGGCGSPAPWVCDYDHDGLQDLLVGAGSDGKVWFYRNTGSAGAPVLASGVKLLKAGAELSVGYRATPCVADWNGDGLPDLLCGDGGGNVHCFPNSGTKQAPLYQAESLLEARGAAVNFNSRSAVRVGDWDGDGVRDLIGSGADCAAWCRNTGSNAAPVLDSPVRLQAPVAGTGLAPVDDGSRMRLEVADWDGDGTPDLLIGGWDGFVHLYRGYRFSLLAVRCTGGGRRVIEWRSAEFLRYDVLRGASPDRIATPVVTGVPAAGEITAWTDTCAEDCQFYRVRIAAPGN